MITRSQPRCVSCGQLQGHRHVLSCPLARFTYRAHIGGTAC